MQFLGTFRMVKPVTLIYNLLTQLISASLIKEFNTPLLLGVKNNTSVEVLELLIEQKAFLEARNTEVSVCQRAFLSRTYLPKFNRVQISV